MDQAAFLPPLELEEPALGVGGQPGQSESFGKRGSAPDANPATARMLFVFPAFLFMAAFGAGMIQNGLYRVLLLLTTGRMIH